MARETVGPPDWEKRDWEKTPYDGVYIYTLNEKPDPQNPEIPLYSFYALKVNPGASIPRHIHEREPEWRETISLEEPGDFEILRAEDSQRVLGERLALTNRPYEVFGIINRDSRPLFFTSRMIPGFTGYQEIEEVKQQDAGSQASTP